MASKAFFAPLLMLLLIGIALGAVGDGPCYTTNRDDSVNTRCGIGTNYLVNSEFGQGAVELCGDCYPCGEGDLVCPNDFGANCDGCCDPDCLVTLQGYVTDAVDNEGIMGVLVRASIPHLLPITYSTTTRLSSGGIPGYYTMQVPECAFEVIASHYDPTEDTFDIQYVDFPIEDDDPYELSFTMGSQECDDECAKRDFQGRWRCRPECHTVANCHYPQGTWTDGGTIDYDIKEACNGSFTSETVYIGSINSTHNLWVDCCDNNPYAQRRVRGNVHPSDDVKNIIADADAGQAINRRGEVVRRYVIMRSLFYTTS